MRPKAPPQMAERISSMRAKRKMSARKLASAIKVGDKRSIYKWESGEQAPSAHFLALLAVALDTTADYLLGLTNDYRVKG